MWSSWTIAIKAQVDQNDQPGQFLITGSTDFLTAPSIAETLAGRVDIVTLWPLSQGELQPACINFRDSDGAEVDLVLEAGDGRVLGIDACGGQFRVGRRRCDAGHGVTPSNASAVASRLALPAM